MNLDLLPEILRTHQWINIPPFAGSGFTLKCAVCDFEADVHLRRNGSLSTATLYDRQSGRVDKIISCDQAVMENALK